MKFRAADGPKISYPLALVKDAPQPDAGEKIPRVSGVGKFRESFS